jgi:uncharacterized protein (TIGR02001 family)
MRKILLVALAASMLCACGSAHAQGVAVSGSLTGATDYVWRGVSQTSQNPAVFAAVNVTGHGFYAGAGTENVKFGGISQEYDVWGGYVANMGQAKLDLGFVRYGYVDAASSIDTVEGKVALSGNLGKLAAHGAAYYTGNYFGSHHKALYGEVGASYPVAPKVTVSGAVGHQQVYDTKASYTTWNLGLGYALTKGVSLDLRYHDTDASALGSLGKSRVTGSFSVAF